MSGFQDSFDKAIWSVVAAIPSGQIMSYGEVARAAGYPRHARMVARAMSRSPELLPWQRVVKADLSIAFEVGSEPYLTQLKLLANEGVALEGGKLVPLESDKAQSLDEILWGPKN